MDTIKIVLVKCDLSSDSLCAMLSHMQIKVFFCMITLPALSSKKHKIMYPNLDTSIFVHVREPFVFYFEANEQLCHD